MMEEISGMKLGRRGLIGLGGALAVGACAPRAGGLGSGGAPRFDWTLSPPEAAGMSRAGIAGIRAALQKLVDDGTVNGVVSAVARRNKLVWYDAVGYRDPDARVPMPRDGIFRMMSSTKPVTAVAVLMMVQEGKLSLDDKVSRFIPSWKNQKVAVAPPGTKDPAQVKLVPLEREITVRHLLTHTSGITSVGLGISGFSTPASLMNNNKIRLMPDDTLASYIPRLGDAALDFQPGSKFDYSPTEAPDAALYLVELLSGQPADVFLRERLFQPLEMHDTSFHVPEAKRHRLVDIYGKKDGKWEKSPDIIKALRGSYISGGGGLCGTVHDFLNFELMLLNKGSINGRRVLKPEMVDLMTADQAGPQFRAWYPPLTKGYDFGLLVRIARDPNNAKGESLGAFGWGGAYGTESWAEPALDVAAAFFVQMSPPNQAAPSVFENAMRAAIVA
jgi:CubicO group peptidase (beta-lactamase class C family)